MVYQGVTMFKRKLSVILAATLATTAFAAKYEAESASLSGGATPGADNSASGSKLVNMNGDYHIPERICRKRRQIRTRHHL